MTAEIENHLKQLYLRNLADAFHDDVRQDIEGKKENIFNAIQVIGDAKPAIAVPTDPRLNKILSDNHLDKINLNKSLLVITHFKADLIKAAKFFKMAQQLTPEDTKKAYELYNFIAGENGKPGYYQEYGKLIDKECKALDGLADKDLLANLVTNTPSSKLRGNREITPDDGKPKHPFWHIIVENIKGFFVDWGVGYLSRQITRLFNAADSHKAKYQKLIKEADAASTEQLRYKGPRDRFLQGLLSPSYMTEKAFQVAAIMMEFDGLTGASHKNLGVHNLTEVDRKYITEFMQSANNQGKELAGWHLKHVLNQRKNGLSNSLQSGLTSVNNRGADTYRGHNVINALCYDQLSRTRKKLQQALVWFNGGEHVDDLKNVLGQSFQFDNRVGSYDQKQLIYEANAALATGIMERLNPGLYSPLGNTERSLANAVKSGMDLTAGDHIRLTNRQQVVSEHGEYSANPNQVWESLNLWFAHFFLNLHLTVPWFFPRIARNILSKQVETIFRGKLFTETLRSIVDFNALCANGKTKNLSHYEQLGKNWQTIDGVIGSLKGHFCELNQHMRMTAAAWKSVSDAFPFLINSQYGNLNSRTPPTYEEFCNALNSVRARFRNDYRSKILDVERAILTPNSIHPLRNPELQQDITAAHIETTLSMQEIINTVRTNEKPTECFILMPDILGLEKLKQRLEGAAKVDPQHYTDAVQQIDTVLRAQQALHNLGSIYDIPYDERKAIIKNALEQSSKNFDNETIDKIFIRYVSEKSEKFECQGANEQVFLNAGTSYNDLKILDPTILEAKFRANPKLQRAFDAVRAQENYLFADFLDDQGCYLKHPNNPTAPGHTPKEDRVVSHELVTPKLWEEVLERLEAINPGLKKNPTALRHIDFPFISKAQQPIVPPAMSDVAHRMGTAHAHKVGPDGLASEYDKFTDYIWAWSWDDGSAGRLYYAKPSGAPVLCFRSAKYYEKCKADKNGRYIADSGWVNLHELATSKGVEKYADSVNAFGQKIENTSEVEKLNSAREGWVGSTCENAHKIITVSKVLSSHFSVDPDRAKDLIIPDRTEWVLFEFWFIKISFPAHWFFKSAQRPTSSKPIDTYKEYPDGMLRLQEQTMDHAVVTRTGSLNAANNIVGFQRRRIEQGYNIAFNILDASERYGRDEPKSDGTKFSEGDTIPAAVQYAKTAKVLNECIGVRN